MTIDEIKSILGFSIIHTARLLVNKTNKCLVEADVDLTTEQMGVLFYIMVHERDTVIQQDIAQVMNKNKSAILRTIDILEKKNFVTREIYNNDRRKNVLMTTEKGRAIVEQAMDIFKKQDKMLSHKLDSNDIQTCMRVLGTIQMGCEENNCIE